MKKALKYFLGAILILALTLPFSIKKKPPITGVRIHNEHGEVVSHNLIMIDGDIDADMVKSVNADLKKVMNSPVEGEPTVIYFNSGGGDLDAGLAIETMLAFYSMFSGATIICVADQDTHSMAFNLFTACPIKAATEGTTFTLHNIAFISIPDPSKRLTARYLKALSDELTEGDTMYQERNAAALGITPGELAELAEQNTVLSTQALIDKGYLNGIVELEFLRENSE